MKYVIKEGILREGTHPAESRWALNKCVSIRDGHKAHTGADSVKTEAKVKKQLLEAGRSKGQTFHQSSQRKWRPTGVLTSDYWPSG